MAYLELADIHKSYYLGSTAFPVLKGINLKFELGNFVSILGESGGGKSTLMNIIGGLDRNFSGEVRVDGERLDHHQERRLDAYRRDTVGYIYQAYNLVSHLSVLDNVKLALDMTRLNAKARDEQARAILTKVGLGDQMRKYPNQLSGGQKQRVAIARALSSDPKIIIADEPTGALDSQNTEEVLKLLQQIAQEGRLVIAVTHSEHVAAAGTRIVRLADGKITGDERIKSAYPLQDVKRLASRDLSYLATLKNTWNHFKYHLGQNALIVAGVSIGLIAVLLFTSLGTGVSSYVNQQINKVANPTAIIVSRRVPVSANTNRAQAAAERQRQQLLNLTGEGKSANHTDFKTSDLNQIKAFKHVNSVERVYNLSNVKVTYGGKQGSIDNLTSWTKSNSASDIKTGRAPKAGEVVLDRNLVINSLGQKRYRNLLGKTVHFSYSGVNQQGKPTTVKFNAKVAGISYSTRQSFNAITAGRLRQAAKAANVPLAASAMAVTADRYDHVEKLVNRITSIKRRGKKQYSALSAASMIETINTYVRLITVILKAIASISLLVSALMIIVTMYMSVAERTKEIGILRALGESKRDIRRLFTSESLLLGLISATVSTLLTYGLAGLGNRMLSRITAYDFLQVTPNAAVSIYVIALVIALLAAFLPARHAAGLNPIDALSND